MRAEVVAMFTLVEIDTADGTYRFLLGQDGIFTDINGQKWFGSSILSGSDDQMVIGAIAPTGSLTVTWQQDPSMPDVIEKMRALGLAYVYGRKIRFYDQFFASFDEKHAPVTAPQLFMTRVSVGLDFAAEGPARRSITLQYEGTARMRNHQRRMVYNTVDHSRLVGAQNPSLQFLPKEYRNQEPLIG